MKVSDDSLHLRERQKDARRRSDGPGRARSMKAVKDAPSQLNLKLECIRHFRAAVRRCTKEGEVVQDLLLVHPNALTCELCKPGPCLVGRLLCHVHIEIIDLTGEQRIAKWGKDALKGG